MDWGFEELSVENSSGDAIYQSLSMCSSVQVFEQLFSGDKKHNMSQKLEEVMGSITTSFMVKLLIVRIARGSSYSDDRFSIFYQFSYKQTWRSILIHAFKWISLIF